MHKANSSAGRRSVAGAFTLLELLVVISIIALLIAMLLPVLSEARRAGRSTVCESHLRVLGQAMRMYADYYDDWAVLGESDDSPATPSQDGSMHFAAALLPVVMGESMNQRGPDLVLNATSELEFMNKLRQLDAFQCPDFPNPQLCLDYVVNAFAQPFRSSADPGVPGAGPMSQGAGPDLRKLFIKVTREIRDTSTTIFLTEAHRDYPLDTVELHDLFLASQLPFGSAPRIANDLRHPGGVNGLFFDTHVEKMALKRLDAGPGHDLGERLRWFTTYKPN